MTSGLAKRMTLRSADFQVFNVFGRKIRQNSPLRSGILFASPEVMHKPRSHSPGVYVSFFLSLVLKTQPNHWTKRMVNTRLKFQ